MRYFSYNTKTGQFYTYSSENRKDRVLRIDNSNGKLFYKNRGINYLTEEETERFKEFYTDVTGNEFLK